MEIKGLEKKFITLVSQIRDPVHFLGIANLLGVDVVRDKKIRSFDDIIEELVQKFQGKERKKKREILGLLKKAKTKLNEVNDLQKMDVMRPAHENGPNSTSSMDSPHSNEEDDNEQKKAETDS